MPEEPAIFISYRRSDAGGHGRALHEYLSGRFGHDRLFFDRSTIESGDEFPDKLRRGVEGCAVLLALIGPEWLDVRGDDGGRRLDDADDFVRREIALALEQGKKVIPVLFDDTPVPPRDRLPDPLAALASCDALTLGGKTYEYRTQRRELVRLLAKVPGVPEPLAEAGEAVAAIGSVPPRHLRQDLADFKGRKREIDALEGALANDGGSAAIVGMGGVGKTELAVHVAHRLKDHYPNGQIVVDLKGTTEPLSPAAAMRQVIVALDQASKLPDDEGALTGLYRSLLAGKRLLILFDNAANAAQVRALLPAPPCTAIVTSRRAVVLEVVPSGLQQVSLDVLAPPEADALLLAIIGEGRASAAARATLADRCGHLPLALRVAGTFLKTYRDSEVAEYVAALADERERLKRLCIEGDPLRDVAAALGLSLRQLARDQPKLAERWRMLAVFAGGFDREAASAVWAVAPAEAHDGLRVLVERSMLQFDAAEQRYQLHDLMRDLALGAAEPLSGEEERLLEGARDRHSARYQAVLAAANALFLQGGEGVASGLARFDQERANIEAGWSWLLAQRTNDKAVARCWRWLLGHAADDKAVSRRRSAYVAAGYAVLPLRQPLREQIEWLEKALAAARRSNNHAEGTHLTNLGLAYHNLGEYRRAIEYHEQTLAFARKIGHPGAWGNALGNLGLAYYRLGEYRRAIQYHKQHIEIARRIGDRRGEGNAFGNLGNAYDSLGELRSAVQCHAQNIAIARHIGDRLGEGNALCNLGLAYYRLGEYRWAIECYQQSLAIARDIGDRDGEGNTLFNWALALDALGERAAAIAHMRAAAEIYAAVESPLAEQAGAQFATWQAERDRREGLPCRCSGPRRRATSALRLWSSASGRAARCGCRRQSKPTRALSTFSRRRKTPTSLTCVTVSSSRESGWRSGGSSGGSRLSRATPRRQRQSQLCRAGKCREVLARCTPRRGPRDRAELYNRTSL